MSSAFIGRKPHETMDRKIMDTILEMGGCDIETLEIDSHMTLDEFLERINNLDVRLELRLIDGELVAVQSSVKSRVEIVIPSEELQLCEIGRYYIKTGHYEPGLCLNGVRETCKDGEAPKVAAARGTEEETLIPVSPADLIPIKNPAHEGIGKIIEVRKSSVFRPGKRPGSKGRPVWSESITFNYRLELAAMPTHPPFGQKVVPLWDGSVCCVCVWVKRAIVGRIVLRRFLRSMSQSTILAGT